MAGQKSAAQPDLMGIKLFNRSSLTSVLVLLGLFGSSSESNASMWGSPPARPIVTAAQQGNLQEVQKLYAADSTNTQANHEALYAALSGNQLAVVKFFNDNNCQYSLDNLRLIAQNGSQPLIEYIMTRSIERGETLPATLLYDWLCDAAGFGKNDIVRYLISRGVSVNCRFIPRFGNGASALMWALGGESLHRNTRDIASQLLLAGAEVNYRSSDNRSAWRQTLFCSPVRKVQLLLCGVNPGLYSKSIFVHVYKPFARFMSFVVANNQLLLALSIVYIFCIRRMKNACFRGWLFGVALLASIVIIPPLVNSDVNDRDSWQGTTALIRAAGQGQLDDVQSLIAKGADCNQPDFYGMTPLLAAAINSHAEVANHLRDSGANIEYAIRWCNTNRGDIGLTDTDLANAVCQLRLGMPMTPEAKVQFIDQALIFSNENILCCFFQRGDRISEGEVYRILGYGPPRGEMRLVKMLVDAAKDKGPPPERIWAIAICGAASRNHFSEVSVYFTEHPDFQVTPEFATAIFIETGHTLFTNIDARNSFFCWLIEHGANLNAVDGEGLTVIQHYERLGYQDGIDFLRKHGAIR